MAGVGICILGMHRSGTSCLAGSLQNAGLQLGEVVENAPHNLKGNRENLQVRNLNDAVLSTSGGAWDRPPRSLRWTQEQAARRDALVELYEALPGRYWGFKDPRTVLTLPFWRERMPDVRLVTTYRHPLAVAQSLAAREQMPFDQGLRLWQAYNETLLSYLNRYGGPLVSFDVSRDEYLVAVDAVMSLLGLAGQGAAIDQRLAFFDETLRHQSSTELALSRVMPHETENVYTQLQHYYEKLSLRS